MIYRRCGMKDRILIDTSAWILSFKKSDHENLKHKILQALNSLTAVTTNIVILELLQGCRDKKEYEAMKSRLNAVELLPVNDNIWEIAYTTGYELRSKGIAVPTVDIIIASIARAYNCTLLHHDRHFKFIVKHLDFSSIDFLDER